MSSRTLELLETLPSETFEGPVWRHMFNQAPPDRENDRGARWNPPGTPAIYCALTREGAIAEADHMLAVNRRRAIPRRMIYKVDVTLANVLRLTDDRLLRSLGLPDVVRAGDDLTPCSEVGGEVAWLGFDGLLIPSARNDNDNLVIYPNNREISSVFEFDAGEDITDSHPPPPTDA